MSVEQFETIALYLCVSGLIAYMFFVMYKLVVESNAGKVGAFVILLTLGLGIFGFVAKKVLTLVISV